MVVIAVINGALRDLWYGKRIGELWAHQISTATAMLFLGVYIWIAIRIWPPTSTRHAAMIGVLWLVLTLAFEFLFGHYVAGHPWQRLLRDYNLLAGRVWVLVPIWVAVAPYLFLRVQR
jgi:hypothetical protein